MTHTPRAAGPETTGSAPGGSAPDGPTEEPAAERLVIRDRRRIDPTGTKDRAAQQAATESAQKPVGRHARPAREEEPVMVNADGTETRPASVEAEPAAVVGASVDGPESTDGQQTAGVQPVAGEQADTGSTSADVAADVAAGERAGAEPAFVEPVTVEPATVEPVTGLSVELEALRADLDERVRDLQRVTAEYANYRKRVDRDRGLAAEQTTGTVLAALLPVLDDLDRAREHGDLVGPFGTVAEQLTSALAKFGLTAFGEKGDPFDPTRHEAVAHLTSVDVLESTCVDVMRRGYLLGDRLLRPALVAVADPE